MKKIKYLAIFSILLLSGCYNYRELSELAITTAIGIDKLDDEYIVTAQVMNIKKKEGSSSNAGNSPDIIMYKSEAKSIKEALRYIVLQSPRKIYFSHLDILLIGEEVAKEGISDILDGFFRDPEVRMQFNVFMTKGVTSEEVLETLTPGQTVSAKNIIASQETDAKFLGTSQMMTFEDLMDMYLDDNKEITIPSVILKGSLKDNDDVTNTEKVSDNTKVFLDSTGIFKGDKLISFIDNQDSIYLGFVKNTVKETLLNYECAKDEYLFVEAINIESGTEFDKKKKEIVISIEGSGDIGEMSCNLNIEKEDVIKKIEKEINDNLKNNLNSFIDKIKNDYNSDIFNFLDIIYKSDYNYYKKIKDVWTNDGFKNIKVSIKSNIDVSKKGVSLREIYDEKE